MTLERFPIESSHVLMFARAIGDANPMYSDGDAGSSSEFGSTVAPPTFVQASAQFDDTYMLRPTHGEPWFGSGAEPTGVRPVASEPGEDDAPSLVSGLHAEQHFEYHRPLLVGDVLTTTSRAGETWEKQGRSGILNFSEQIIEFRGSDGELVVTARSVGVVTQGPVAGDR